MQRFILEHHNQEYDRFMERLYDSYKYNIIPPYIREYNTEDRLKIMYEHQINHFDYSIKLYNFMHKIYKEELRQLIKANIYSMDVLKNAKDEKKYYKRKYNQMLTSKKNFIVGWKK